MELIIAGGLIFWALAVVVAKSLTCSPLCSPVPAQL
jgi:hypothetical protein